MYFRAIFLVVTALASKCRDTIPAALSIPQSDAYRNPNGGPEAKDSSSATRPPPVLTRPTPCPTVPASQKHFLVPPNRVESTLETSSKQTALNLHSHSVQHKHRGEGVLWLTRKEIELGPHTSWKVLLSRSQESQLAGLRMADIRDFAKN